MDLGFSGSTAVVTGGSKGMCLAIAETLAAEGASVAVMEVCTPMLKKFVRVRKCGAVKLSAMQSARPAPAYRRGGRLPAFVPSRPLTRASRR